MNSRKRHIPQLSDLIDVALTPTVWLQAVIIVCAYVAYKATDDYSLYANEVLGYSEVQSAGVGTLGLWLRPIFAIFAGYLADKWSGSRVSIYSFLVLFITGGVIATGIFESIIAINLTILLSTLIGVYAIRGIYFALLQDAAIPIEATGTAVGIVSVVGFLPDVFMGPLMGVLLDNNPGAEGHRYVFAVLAGFALIGLIASLIFHRVTDSE